MTKEEIKTKYLKAKNKPMYIAKMFMRKKKTSGKVWNLSECIRITKCIEKYVNGDTALLNRIFEYVNMVENIDSKCTIYSLLNSANEYVVDNKFTNKSKTKPAINLMKLL